MTEVQKLFLSKLVESIKNKNRKMPIKRNQLARGIGRLIIAYNDLENRLAQVLMTELVKAIAGDEQPTTDGRSYLSPSSRRAHECGLTDILMATLSFKVKLDFLTALLLKRFDDNEKHKEYILQIKRQLTAADSFRNKIVHSVWEESLGEFSRKKAGAKTKVGLKIDKEKADVKKLREASEKIKILEGFLFYTSHTSFEAKYLFSFKQFDECFGETPAKKQPKISIHPQTET